MQSIEDLSVLILAYNRFEKFSRCIKTLYEQGIKKIYVSIDGPKNNLDLINQEKIKRLCISNKYNLDIKLNQFKKNYGCRKGPINGISWFFLKNEYGVILEDDVILSRSCLKVFLLLLKENLDRDEFMSISSFNEYTNKQIESIYSIPVWRSWGWASWSDKWQKHIEFSKKITNYNLWQLYNLLPYNLRSMETVKLVKASQLNMLDAWDYEFNFSHIVNKNYSLTIGGINNYVYGFDNSATHTIDIKTTGIDFNLFTEREIDPTEIIYNQINYYEATLSKCGFFYRKNKGKIKLLNDFQKNLFYTFIFQLRKIKRIIFKTFKINKIDILNHYNLK
tara:strand:+ start:13389 stop:14393 length:1005 start_codon:yes stop_codon:yes gene_type:complete